MALIRQADRSRVTRDAVVLNLADVAAQARRVEAAAADAAARIVREAASERDRLVADAAAKGYAEGLAKGRADGYAKGRDEGKAAVMGELAPKLDELQARWATALAEFEVIRERILGELRQDAVGLALLIAQRVIKRTIEVDPGIVASQLEAVAAQLAKPTRLLVRIHPDDEPVSREALPQILARFSNVTHAELVLDPTLDRGSCVARSAGGEIDASITTQIDRIAEALLPACGIARKDAA